MKRLFRPKSSKSSQPNTVPTPVSSEQFRSIQYLRTQSEETSYDDLSLQAPLPPIPHSQSAPYPSPLIVNNPNQLYSASYNNIPAGSNSPRHSSHSLLGPGSNPFKKKHAHATAAILKSLDPDDISLHRSRTPSLESIPKFNDIDRYYDHRLTEPERDTDQQNNNERKDNERRHKDQKNRDKERFRQLDQDSIRQERQEVRDKSPRKDKHKEKEKKRNIFSRDKDKDKDRNGSAELTRMIGTFLPCNFVSCFTMHFSGYLTATASEDWSLVLEVCERASISETTAKEACKALRREFKYVTFSGQFNHLN